MIKNIIYKYLQDKKDADNLMVKKPENQLHWSPSSYCRCLRQQYYKKIGEPITNEISIHTILKFEMGKGIHYQLKELYRRIDKFYNNQEKFKYIEADFEFTEKEWAGIKWRYQTDDLISVNGETFIIENKSKYGAGIEAVKRMGIDKDYEIQLLLYMILEKIERGEFFFIATDSAYCEDFAYAKDMLVNKYKEYMIDRNKKIIKILKDVELFYKTGEKILPEREGKVNLKKDKDKLKLEFQKDSKKYKSYPCAWGENRCAYFNNCWKEVIDNMKDFSYYVGGEFVKEK